MFQVRHSFCLECPCNGVLPPFFIPQLSSLYSNKTPSARAYGLIDSRAGTVVWNVHVYYKQCCCLHRDSDTAKSRHHRHLMCMRKRGAASVVWPPQTFHSGDHCSTAPSSEMSCSPHFPFAFFEPSDQGFRLQPLCNLLMLSSSLEVFCWDN